MGQHRVNGAAIRALRERTEISGAALARDVRALGVKCHDTTLYNIENEVTDASSALAAGIARALKVPVTAILREPVPKEQAS